MATYEVVGSKPQNLLAHSIAKEYTITGLTPDNFIKTHSGLDFDIQALRAEFRKHCTDYMLDLVLDKPSYSVEFCSKIIYEIGPESRKVRKGTGDKLWKFIFDVQNVVGATTTSTKHTVFVATYKQDNAVYEPDNKEKSMILTLKQAGLIALETFSRLIKIAYSQNMKLMTPLAGACFSKDDTHKFAEEMNMTEIDLLIAINQSTQGGGQYLLKSNINIAVCAAIAATRNVKEDTLKKNIVVKVLKQYMNKGMSPDKKQLSIICRYATGGVPQEFAYEELIRMFELEQSNISAIRQAKAIKESTIQSMIDVPSGSA